MKAVYRSIKPYWLFLILIGEKTIEVGKTFPKATDWNKSVFLHCSKDMKSFKRIPEKYREWMRKYLGKVACRFVCDKVENIEIRHFTVFGHENVYTSVGENPDYQWLKKSCLSYDEVVQYGKLAPLYGWHISDLVIYHKPRELSEFYVEGDCDCMNCKTCAWFDCGNGYNVEDDCNLAYKGIELHKSFKPITRPPQSWCYVESNND